MGVALGEELTAALSKSFRIVAAHDDSSGSLRCMWYVRCGFTSHVVQSRATSYETSYEEAKQMIKLRLTQGKVVAALAAMLAVAAAMAEAGGPPPGTLGQTYDRPSRSIPADKHPRIGMIDVRVLGAQHVVVRDLKEFRTEEQLEGFRDVQNPHLWHFESKPLYPGLPHIYRVEAMMIGPEGPRMEIRYVRLIMGRLVNLTI